ncbi:glycoside hydrolase family 43 protein [Nonomuraea sp. NPDC050691]|uniref:glycoside hydrolase family 43 protein n=1 Tax=Nonomuraea sp. NPDC050691 TaxID=3155661 RepID=UPI0033FEAF09
MLTSTVGTRGVRDPFIIRSPQGDKFYQIATDLRMHGNGNWDQVQRTGSKSIVVWESTDLVNWSVPRLARVSPDTAGNTWAPEAYYDEGVGQYVVFWASKLYSAGDPNHIGNTYNRMMYATTSDFRTFSAAQVWVDKGYSTIDSTLIKHNGTYYRFTKDERSSSQTPCGKFILAERSTTMLNRNYSFLADCLGNKRGGTPAATRCARRSGRPNSPPPPLRGNVPQPPVLLPEQHDARGPEARQQLTPASEVRPRIQI